MKKDFVIKGHIIWSDSLKHLNAIPHGYLVCEGGLCTGVFRALPDRYAHLPLKDYGGHLIMPAVYDLHLHAPQLAYCGMGMDLELIDWLNAYAFPEEAKFADLDYARRAYTVFADTLRSSYTARFCCFATMHAPATLLLAELLEASGLRGYVGKVSMDRNAPADLCEPSAEAAARDCEQWIVDMQARFTNIKPMLTPRFIPSCSDALMERLHKLADKYGVPAQSHLSENHDEIAWVKALCPTSKNYASVYDHFGMLSANAVMAHVVYPQDEEITLLKQRRTMVAHCPASNTNLRSGIAPVRRLLSAGVRVGLGSDVAGGESIDMLRAAAEAIQASKLYWRLIDQAAPALTFPEVFYMATKGGGSFFGKAGSFEPGYMLDALVLDDRALRTTCDLTLPQRLERALYRSAEIKLTQKYVDGTPLFEEPVTKP
ncbi:MAG TPA: amidohydrolase family protein [Candidatus Limiplasma sp.]|nr:amidohydrolase family protein [Candidatus Limiplasma sp.]